MIRSLRRIRPGLDVAAERFAFFRFCFRAAPMYFVLTVLGTLVLALVPGALAASTGWVVDSVSEGVVGELPSHLPLALGVFATSSVAPFLFRDLVENWRTWLGRLVDDRVAQRVATALKGMPNTEPFDRSEFLDLVHRASGMAARGQSLGTAVTALSRSLVARGGGLSAALVLVPFSILLTLGLVCFWTVLAVVARRQYLGSSLTTARLAPSFRRWLYLFNLGAGPDAAKEIKLFGAGAWIASRTDDAGLSSLRPLWDDRRRELRVSVPGTALAGVVSLGALGLVASAAAGGEISSGQAVAYGMAVLGLVSLASIGRPAVDFIHGYQVFPHLQKLEDACKAPPPETAKVGGGSIVLENVTYTYPDVDRPALDRLSLQIPAGCTTAIVGLNGAGKSTLLKVLSGLVLPASGEIRCGGTRLGASTQRAWQGMFSAVLQDFVRYPLTARENVVCGAEGIDEDAYRWAIRTAQVDGFLTELPHGEDTILSRALTEGTDISGGQWQRLGIARGLYFTQQAPFLLMDEPGANLDPAAEEDLYRLVLERTTADTTIFVSHRLGAVRRADRILVIADGRLVESGTHDALMGRQGAYHRLFEMQASHYR